MAKGNPVSKLRALANRAQEAIDERHRTNFREAVKYFTKRGADASRVRSLVTEIMRVTKKELEREKLKAHLLATGNHAAYRRRFGMWSDPKMNGPKAAVK